MPAVSYSPLGHVRRARNGSWFYFYHMQLHDTRFHGLFPIQTVYIYIAVQGPWTSGTQPPGLTPEVCTLTSAVPHASHRPTDDARRLAESLRGFIHESRVAV